MAECPSYLHSSTSKDTRRKRPRVYPFKFSDAGYETMHAVLQTRPNNKKQQAVPFVAVDDSTFVPVLNDSQRSRKGLYHQERLKAEREIYAEHEEISTDIYEECIQNRCKRNREDSDEDVDDDDEDHEEMEEGDFTCKLQQAREARDELKFTVTHLESKVKNLEKELEEFRNQPKATPVYEIRVLEALVADLLDDLKQYQEKLIVKEEINKTLQEEVSLLKASSVCSSQDSFEKLVQRICESEKDKVMQELQTVQDARMKLQEEYDTLLREKSDIELQNLELKEAIKMKPKARRGRKTQDENLALAPDEVVQSVLHEIAIESDPDAESGSKLRPRRRRFSILLRAFRKRLC